MVSLLQSCTKQTSLASKSCTRHKDMRFRIVRNKFSHREKKPKKCLPKTDLLATKPQKNEGQESYPKKRKGQKMGTSKLFIYFSFLVISVFGAMPPPHKCPYWMSHGIVRRTEREREKGPSKADFLQGMSKCSSLSILTLFRKQSIPFYPLYGQRKQLPQSLYLYTLDACLRLSIHICWTNQE